MIVLYIVLCGRSQFTQFNVRGDRPKFRNDLMKSNQSFWLVPGTVSA